LFAIYETVYEIDKPNCCQCISKVCRKYAGYICIQYSSCGADILCAYSSPKSFVRFSFIFLGALGDASRLRRETLLQRWLVLAVFLFSWLT